MGTLAIWRGTSTEALELIRAISANCSCLRLADGSLSDRCGAHAAMTDQRFLDHMLYLRRLWGSTAVAER